MTAPSIPPAMGPNTGTIAYDQLDLPFPAIAILHGQYVGLNHELG